MGQAGSPPAILRALQTRAPLIHLLLSSSRQLTPMQGAGGGGASAAAAHLESGHSPQTRRRRPSCRSRWRAGGTSCTSSCAGRGCCGSSCSAGRTHTGRAWEVWGGRERWEESACVEIRSMDPRVRKSSRTCCTPAGTGTSTTSGFQTCQTR